MRVWNVLPILQIIQLRTLALFCHLTQRTIEIINLPLKTFAIRAIRKVTLRINDGKHRIENAPLRFTVRLQERIAKSQSIAEIYAHLVGCEPLVVVLAKVWIAGSMLAPNICPQPR